MSDVEKGRAALVTCCLNNLYGFYVSLQTFFNFLIIFFNFLKTTEKKQNNLQNYLMNDLKVFQKEG